MKSKAITSLPFLQLVAYRAGKCSKPRIRLCPINHFAPRVGIQRARSGDSVSHHKLLAFAVQFGP